MILMIDNYDSFTYNLVQYFQKLNFNIQVLTHHVSIKKIKQLNPSHLVISPGPGKPSTAGNIIPIIKAYSGKIPILGICLGHQAIAASLGGNIILAKKTMHGKTSFIFHHQRGIFKNIPSPFLAVRYHSLVVEKEKLPENFEISAWTLDGNGEIEEIMAINHVTYPLCGVQFHPESILTEHGLVLLTNFCSLYEL